MKKELEALLRCSEIYTPKGATLSSHIYQDICVQDSYQLRRRDCRPRVVYDIGAHIGCFAAQAREVWPNAKIVCVEPDPDNIARLQNAEPYIGNMQIEQAALGKPPMHFCRGTGSDSHAYQGPSELWPLETFGTRPGVIVPSNIKPMTLSEMLDLHRSDGPYVVKVDVEGAECVIFEDPQAIADLRAAELFIFEYHVKAPRRMEPTAKRYAERYLQTHGHVIDQAMRWLFSMCDSHRIEIDIVHPLCWICWGTKRPWEILRD